MSRCDYRVALTQTGVLSRLAPFDPHVAGTPPLDLDIPGSDIEILCHAPDADAFVAAVWEHFGELSCFAVHQWTRDGQPVIVRFHASGWEFELFAAAEPVDRQVGWRHFRVGRRLLALGGVALCEAIMARRNAGMKTEPAFAAALGLQGDPYRLLLMLDGQSDEALIDLLQKRPVALPPFAGQS
jgi:hypothetical protein